MDDERHASAASFRRAPCGLLSTAPDGTILTANDQFLSWLGSTRRELIGQRRFDELLTMPCRIYYETHYAPLLRIQGFVQELALELECCDGHVLPVFVNAVEERSEDGALELMRVAVFAGVDRRAYERELLLERRSCEQAIKAKADFLAMFAHEIRNPLAAVLMETELLARQRGVDATHASIARMRESLDRVLALLNNMLGISKLEAGKVSLEESDFEIADVVQAVVHTLRALAEPKELQLQLRIDPALPARVRGDPVKLGQALTNLVSNAIKFTDRGSVMIGVELVSQSRELVNARFWVRDTGIGIPPDRQAAIFDEYVQADPNIARRYGGTGLGLAITAKLIELQRGKLNVSSEPGRGSLFWFEIPLSRAA